jgi:hypothetical protein
MTRAWIQKYGPAIAAAAGADVPLGMLLGHVQHESGGRPNDRTKLDERGLFQIHPATSREMGFDHNRMFDPFYSIQTGVEMFRRMADRLARDFPTLLPVRNEFFWRMVRFEFSIGSGATRKILRTMLDERVLPRTWPAFVQYITARRDALFRLTKHDPIKWAGMVDRVFATGETLQGRRAAAGGAAVLGLLAVAGIFLYARSRSRARSSRP